MVAKKYQIHLSDEQRQQLTKLVKTGKSSARVIRRAHTLLLAAEGYSDAEIARLLPVSVATIERTRKQWVDHQGELDALQECSRPGRPRKLDSVGESILIATACSAPPDSRTSWTLQLLADRLVQLEVIEAVSPNTIGRTLKKTT